MKLQLYSLLYLLPLISAVPLNPQPLPPGRTIPVADVEKRAPWPPNQPSPLPQVPPDWVIKGKDRREALNPQPLPPGFHGGDEVAERDASAIQPQPLPPGIRPPGGH